MRLCTWLMVGMLASIAGGTAQGAPPAAKPKTAATKPATGPTKTGEVRRPGRKNATVIPPTVMSSLEDLRKEFELGRLRQKSDYFDKAANPELTPQLVVQLLGRSMGSSGAMDGYVKWQLLSALPEQLPTDLEGAVLDAYRSTPALEPRPAMSIADRRMLDRELRTADDPADIAAQLDQEVRRTDALNRSVTAYRDELFLQLPDNLEAYEAALNDIYERCMAGMTPRSIADQLSVRATRWVREANRNDVQQLGAMVRKLLSMQMPEYYEGIRRGERDRLYSWETRRADPNTGGRLRDILDAVDSSGAADAPSERGRGGRRGR